jgi:hypothetical protein
MKQLDLKTVPFEHSLLVRDENSALSAGHGGPINPYLHLRRSGAGEMS